MTKAHNQRWGTLLRLPGWLALLLLAASARAQAPLASGDGLRGDYYDGTNFEKFVLTRRDATINFNWHQQPPVPGLLAELFSVRWTGWLVPPASGKYIFHVTVDDGVLLWLNDRLLLNEWRGQPLSNYTASVELRAGEPYRLRVDYCQYGLDSRAEITWERVDAPESAPPSSWRNLWGLAAEKPAPQPIPMRYFFTRNPRPETSPPPAAAPVKPVVVPAAPPPTVKAPPKMSALPKPRRQAPAKPPSAALPTPAPALVADSSSRTQLAHLAVGEAVTLPELYFNQGQALLLPPARAALDGLAATLKSQPTLRFEVQGHTDNVGNAELNRQLSQQRAEAVCLYLTAHGVTAGQLRAVGYGGTQPVADNADPSQRPLNRRVLLRRL